jgi:hypothetical protein
VPTIAEINLLVRAHMELPVDLKLATCEFRDGWESIRPEDAGRLKKKMRTSGWNFIKIGDKILKSGIGDTSQEAIASALKLALRMISDRFAAAEVGDIRLTRYPWFCLASVTVFPYWIQRSSASPVPDRATLLEPAPRRGRPRQAHALDMQFASDVPHLTQALISSLRIAE